ncbi:hypothetical protein K432DRAFT_428858 [Lepidopterella palustris CBS 459.81]|uniref:Uncharacterized protein n=1 Tax=Lepidopterella palustris CBS 459.81 TaxID=1314670 RepID=A0A8E2E2S7_9PEZI|nr:hypothetical protein K432DRAFT_428858 [Lepidopterella palustris CBS 459.81]
MSRILHVHMSWVSDSSYDVRFAAEAVLLTIAIAQLAWIVYGVICRLVLSSITHIPGPKLADSLAGTVGYELHQKRRAVRTTFFSQSVIFKLEVLLRRKVGQLGWMLMRGAVEESQPIFLICTMGFLGSRLLLVFHFPFALFVLWCCKLGKRETDLQNVAYEYCFGGESNVIKNPARPAEVRHNLTTLLRA